MGKTSRRKQTVKAFEKGIAGVEIPWKDTALFGFEVAVEESDKSDARQLVTSFLRRLSECDSLVDQVRMVQSEKAAFKGILSSSNESLSQAKDCFCDLLVLYLLPHSLALRNSLEWLADIALKSSAFSSEQFTEYTAESCCRVLALARAQNFTEIPIDLLLSWTFSLECISLLDKERRWLGRGVSIFEFLSAAMDIFKVCAGKITLTQDSIQSKSSAEVLRYVESCGQCMRVISNILKSRKLSLRSTDENWEELCRDVYTYGAQILNSNLVNKDALTMTALGVLNIQYYRFYGITKKYGIQLLCTLVSILCTESQLGDFQSFVDGVGLDCQFCCMLQGLPILAKAAMVRALLSIFEVDIFLDCESITTELGVTLLKKCRTGTALGQFSEAEINSDSFGILFGILYEVLILLCNHPKSILQFYGLQMLELWFNRVEDAILRPCQSSCIRHSQLVLIVSHSFEIVSILTDCWSHQSKKVNHLVPMVYQRLIDLVHVVDSQQPQELRLAYTEYKANNSASLETPGASVDIWTGFISCALFLAPQHRARYQALSILLPKIGASRLLHLQPKIIETLLSTSMRIRDISSSVSSFISTFLYSLYREGEIDGMLATTASTDTTGLRPVFANRQGATSVRKNKVKMPQDDTEIIKIRLRPIWTEHVAASLCSSNPKQRDNSADYLLSSVLEFDPHSAIYLINLIRSLPESVSIERKLWGLVNIVLQCRTLAIDGPAAYILPILNFSTKDCSTRMSLAESGSLLAQEAYWACMSNDVHLRLTTFAILTTSHRTLSPMPQHELEVIKLSIPFSLKSPLADHRHRLVRVIKNLIVRMKEVSRAASKNADKEVQYLKSNSRESELEENEIVCYAKVCDKSVADICDWLSSLLLESLYPGSPFEREVLALDLIHAVFDSLEEKDLRLSSFFTQEMTKTILNIFNSSWDRSRNLASDLLLKFPKPWTGYSDTIAIGQLVNYALQLTGSPRLREADAGALMIRNIFYTYVISLGFEFSFSGVAKFESPPEQDASLTSTACVKFINELIFLLEQRLKAMRHLFSLVTNPDISEGKSASVSADIESKIGNLLCSGLVLAIRYCICEVYKVGFTKTSSHGRKSAWSGVINRVYVVVSDALSLAMEVVAEAPSDVPFFPIVALSKVAYPSGCQDIDANIPDEEDENGGDHGAELLAKGPINSTTKAQVSNKYMFVNTNTFMGAAEDGDPVSNQSDLSSSMQRAVVGAWLLVKESTNLLAYIATLSAEISIEGDTSSAFVSSETVNQLGLNLLDGLGRLKHMGAISETHNAFQILCEGLLRLGEKNPELCRMPLQWLTVALLRLESQQQVFILRRSAGFAYAFLSLLRSEPGNCEPTMLPLSMETLFRNAKYGLMSSDLDSGKPKVHWRTCVHSLNIIRLIILDSAMGPDIDSYLSEATIIAVNGFKSPRWAVRNSSMMVFASIVQRAIDNDKNTSGGSRAATANEFFARYPTLLPFLLTELATILDFFVEIDSSGSVTNVFKSDNEKSRRFVSEDPSLFPILLLLSKLRPSFSFRESDNQLVPGTEIDGEIQLNIGNNAGYSLFIPLLRACGSMAKYQVRGIAARAMVAIVSIDLAISMCLDLLNYWKLVSEKGHGDEMHGCMLQILEFVLNTKNLIISGRESEVSINKVKLDLISQFLPAWSKIEFDKIYQSPILLIALRISNLVNEILQTPYSYQVLVTICLESLSAIFDPIMLTQRSLTYHPFPMQPLVWKEALEMLVEIEMGQNIKKRESFPRVVGLMALLEHPVKEVREGIIGGFLKFTENVTINFDTYDLPSLASLYDVDLNLISSVIKILLNERVPPILSKALHLLTIISTIIPFQILCNATKSIFKASIPVIISITVGRNPSRGFHIDSLDSVDEFPPDQLNPSSASASAIEIIGWIVSTSFVNTDVQELSREDMGIFKSWVSLVSFASFEYQNIILRNAAVQSIKKSRLLPCGVVWVHGQMNSEVTGNRHSSEVSALFLQLWLTALRLFQDDDEDIRGDIADVIIESHNLDTKYPNMHTFNRIVDTPLELVKVNTALIEAVAEIISKFLALNFKDNNLLSIEGFLGELFKSIGDGEMIKEMFACVQSSTNEKIFEAEQENLYAETVTTVSILSKTVGLTLDILLNMPGAENNIDLLRSSLVDKLISETASAIEILNSPDIPIEVLNVIGGKLYNRDIYNLVIGCLRASMEISKCFQSFQSVNSTSSMLGSFLKSVDCMELITAELREAVIRCNAAHLL